MKVNHCLNLGKLKVHSASRNLHLALFVNAGDGEDSFLYLLGFDETFQLHFFDEIVHLDARKAARAFY